MPAVCGISEIAAMTNVISKTVEPSTDPPAGIKEIPHLNRGGRFSVARNVANYIAGTFYFNRANDRWIECDRHGDYDYVHVDAVAAIVVRVISDIHARLISRRSELLESNNANVRQFEVSALDHAIDSIASLQSRAAIDDIIAIVRLDQRICEDGPC